MSENKTAGNQPPQAQNPSDDTPEQVRIRVEKRAQLLESGVNPYPVQLPVTATIAQIREQYSHLEAGDETEDLAGVAGRVMFLRNTGKLCFVTIQDGAGSRLQAMLSANEVGMDSLQQFKTAVDLGDHLYVHGRVISSRRGELSIMATAGGEGTGAGTFTAAPAWALAAKAVRPLPKTFTAEDGTEVSLSEEQRVRRRELDMIMRQSARDMVRTRSLVMRSLRQWFDQHDFLEVETPMLQNIHGGAAARPFTTHMNAYDTDLYLRIAPELFLKRCLIGGVENVFEINRNFRNEGADSSHSPEFTMLEAYQAYGTYDTIGQLTQDIVQNAAIAATGSTKVTLPDGTEYDLGGEWKQIGLYESLSEKLGEEVTPETSRERLLQLAEQHEVEVEDYYVDGKIVETLWEELVGDHLWEPTFVRDFPVDTSPLVKAHRSQPGKVEKWDLIVRGFELATGYSELNDPVVQRERFEQQSLDAANGDPEAMEVDEEFLQAMEQGMPPAGGMGMGIDRLLMAITGQGIRETITFPLVKRL
ncbi:lysine--tRNA ligase [Boudabousia marimammalium]|uniref:Lysine--tRNA ligase n=1 Tax=Boudabousia marimammalium TaxID=156892 RepID=A0A1Q5PJA5_9ACTO|nr:lysine--tRNA ligase [Boudabousia marimammalium]OKL45925.1 lysine--tRNA ligase [Boudabousia marimammalium]